MKGQLKLVKGVLYRKTILENNAERKPRLQLILPLHLTKKVLNSCHDQVGHQCIVRTLSLLRERFYWPGTLCNMLGTLSEHDKLDWKTHLSSMTHDYNCTQHPSTTYFPYFLMFGRQPRLPIDFEMGLPVDVLGDSCSKTRFVQKTDTELCLQES